MQVEWRPNEGPQTKALERTEYEVLYGGARGGGKTDAGLVWMTEYIGNQRFRGLVIRKNADDLSDWVDRARRMYSGLGVTVAYKPPILTFPSGAVIKTGHLKDDQAYTKYQGHEYQRILIEELTQIPDEKRYMQLLGSCRSTDPTLKPQIFMTTNPGGLGHGWVKKRFIDNGPWNEPYTDKDTGLKRIFIEAKVDDNPVLTSVDPGYVRWLDGLKKIDEQLWKAWRLGSWDVFIGQAFTMWRPELHVEPNWPYSLDSCQKVIGFDWGYTAPAALYYLALAPENKYGVRHVYVYNEIYQDHVNPSEWGEQIRQKVEMEPVDYMILPHDCYSEARGDASIAKIFQQTVNKDRHLLQFRPGPTMAKGARKSKVALMRQLLSVSPDGTPFLQVHPSCKNFIRTLPNLIYDENNIEDIDSDGEDHAYDAVTGGAIVLVRGSNTGGGAVTHTSGPTAPKAWTVGAEGAIESLDFWSEFAAQASKKTYAKDPYPFAKV